MASRFRAAMFCAALIPGVVFLTHAHQAGVDRELVACRVLEAHTAASASVTAVVFHYQTEADRERLGALLRAHSGEMAEIELSGGPRIEGTVFRLKSCFGRGLLIIPAGAAQIKEGSTFTLRFAQGGATK